MTTIFRMCCLSTACGSAAAFGCLCDVAAAAPNVGRYIDDVARNADDILRFLPILLALAGKLAGVAAVIAAGVLAKDKGTDEAARYAVIVSLVGGAWTAYSWFGWPVVSSDSGTRFSFFAFIGMVIFAFLGIVACTAIIGAAQSNGEVDASATMEESPAQPPAE